MADILLRDIDPQMTERIMAIARERDWPIQDVVLHLLRQSLGLAEPLAPVPGDIARLSGAWEDSESRAFGDALRALESLPTPDP
ncbi:hypothetical protein [Coralloluteibacterium thermophilus]|uniref:Uncharacterized protein n=1 Tax=Coralloluteibacterium thermophilum TaxID=2707049 RepID=A0ABV9NG83_9GAMM